MKTESNVRIDVRRNRIYLTMIGFHDVAEATRMADAYIDAMKQCEPGFSVLVDVSQGPGPLQDLRVTRTTGEIVFSWTEPATSLATRVYSDTSARDAAVANGSSATARLECQGFGGCREAMPSEPLLFFQAVSVCADGVNEGPN